jgi:hypothetical protein
VADARVRDLERAAGAGDVDARARLLVERVRAGRLTQERLELAAYCGHPAAREVLGDQELVRIHAAEFEARIEQGRERQRTLAMMTPGLRRAIAYFGEGEGPDFAAWLEGLAPWNDAPCFATLRAAADASRTAHAALAARGWACGWPSSFLGPPGGRCKEACAFCNTLKAIEAGEGWLANPGEDRRRACFEAQWDRTSIQDFAAILCDAIAFPETLRKAASISVQRSVDALSFEQRAAHLVAVRAGIRRALIRWALA